MGEGGSLQILVIWHKHKKYGEWKFVHTSQDLNMTSLNYYVTKGGIFYTGRKPGDEGEVNAIPVKVVHWRNAAIIEEIRNHEGQIVEFQCSTGD